MRMPSVSRQQRDIVALRADLAELAVDVGLIRLERALSRKYRPDQPREPAGRPGGGRWVGDGREGKPGGGRSIGDEPATTGSLGRDGPASTRTDEAVTEDGSRVLTIRIRSNPHAEWDEQHTVTAPDGTRTVFETSGPTQTVRDGETGEILGRSTLTTEGAEPEAFVQPVWGVPRLPGELQRLAARTLEAAASLVAALSGRNSGDRKAVFAAPASEYVPGDAYNERAMWVGAIGQRELDQICPRNREVQALADSVAASVRATGNYMGEQDFGNKVHTAIKNIINSQKDPDFRAETSYDPTTGGGAPYGARGSIRLDVLEKSGYTTVCVYDHKTGKAVLKATRAVDIMTVVQKYHPGAQRLIMI